MALTLAAKKQQRLDVLMSKNNEGYLTLAEHDELKILVREAEEIMLANARLLAALHTRLVALQSGMTFAQILAPLQEEFDASGMTDEELGELIDAELKAYRAEHRANEQNTTGV